MYELDLLTHKLNSEELIHNVPQVQYQTNLTRSARSVRLQETLGASTHMASYFNNYTLKHFFSYFTSISIKNSNSY